MFKQFSSLLIPILICLSSCTTQKQTTTLNYTGYKVENQKKQDATILAMLAPYADSINKTMNEVIGFSIKGMSKRLPESELGNFITDCMKEIAEQKFAMKIDAAFMNEDGIRSYIAKGDITIGKVYELMPFDNVLVVQQIKGTVLKALLTNIAEKGGWPVSKGFKMQIRDKKAINVTLNGNPIEDNETYNIVNSDYVANGGSGCSMLVGIKQLNKGILMRDVYIEFIKQLTKQGKPIDWKVEGRVTY